MIEPKARSLLDFLHFDFTFTYTNIYTLSHDDLATLIHSSGVNLILPTDYVMGSNLPTIDMVTENEISEYSGSVSELDINGIKNFNYDESNFVLDIGTDTQDRWLTDITNLKCSSLIMIGTTGYCEFSEFSNGTTAVLEGLSKKIDTTFKSFKNENEDEDDINEESKNEEDDYEEGEEDESMETPDEPDVEPAEPEGKYY